MVDGIHEAVAHSACPFIGVKSHRMVIHRTNFGDRSLGSQGIPSHALVPNSMSFPRRIYDAIICLLDSKHAPPNETRKILERGMRSGAVSMVKDVSRTLLFLYFAIPLPPT